MELTLVDNADRCPPDCTLCAVARKIEAHYDGCGVCNGPDIRVCSVMLALEAEQNDILKKDLIEHGIEVDDD